MKINFAWIGAREEFDALIHTREDEKIFHLEIKQKEAGFARARIDIANPGYGLLWPQDKQYCAISFDQRLVFKGRLQAMPSRIDGQLVTLEFTAVADEVEEKKKQLCQQIIDEGCYDNLFFGGREVTLSELLQSYTALPYWSRTDGSVILSDIFKGQKKINLGENFFRDSLAITIAGSPLAQVDVDLKAEWLQQARGVVEIGQHIKRQCPHGYLSTLTGQSLEGSWWNKRRAYKQNGYRVEGSSLKQIHPKNTEEFPTASRSFWHYDGQPKKVQFARNWYDLQLRLGWSYRQKRREIATFSLKQSVQNLNGQADRSKRLSFNLASILGKNHHWRPDHIYTAGFQVLHDDAVYRCKRRHASGAEFNLKKWQRLDNYAHVDGQSARAEFFSTDRGQQAIRYALEVAKAHLAASARCIVVGVRARLQDVVDITLDHTLKLKDSRLPGGEVRGKVIGYRFMVDGKTGERVADIRMGVSIGTGISVTQSFGQQEWYAQDDILAENIPVSDARLGRSKSVICFEIPADAPAPMGIRRPQLLSEAELIEQIEILNDAQTQNAHLSQKQYPHALDMKQVLKAKPTDVRIKLKDLKTFGCLEHEVPVRVLTTWSAPQHINLSAHKE